MSAALELLRAAQEGDREACEQAVVENNGLIWSVVRRYYGRGVDPEDPRHGHNSAVAWIRRISISWVAWAF